MLNIGQGRRDLIIALVGRTVSTFGDGVALVALTLRLQADGAHPSEVGLLLAAGTIPLLVLARPVGRLVDAHDSRRLLVGGGLVETAATIPLVFLHSIAPIVLLVSVLGAAASVTGATWSALIPRVVGGIGNGYAGACLSTLLTARTPDSARGRVSAAANAVFGGAQGVSLLVGGLVAIALSPRAIYALAGLLGLAAVGLVAVMTAARPSSRAAPLRGRGAAETALRKSL